MSGPSHEASTVIDFNASWCDGRASVAAGVWVLAASLAGRLPLGSAALRHWLGSVRHPSKPACLRVLWKDLIIERLRHAAYTLDGAAHRRRCWFHRRRDHRLRRCPGLTLVGRLAPRRSSDRSVNRRIVLRSVSDLSVSRRTGPYLPTQPPGGQDRTMNRMRSVNLSSTMLCAAALSLAALSLTACSDSGSPSNTGTPGAGTPAAAATGTAPAGGLKTVSAKALCDYLSGQLPKLKAMGSEVGAMANLTGNLYSWYNGQGAVPDGNQMDEQTLKECPDVRTEVLKAAGVKTFMEL